MNHRRAALIRFGILWARIVSSEFLRLTPWQEEFFDAHIGWQFKRLSEAAYDRERINIKARSQNR